jgi:hypothetical protein
MKKDSGSGSCSGIGFIWVSPNGSPGTICYMKSAVEHAKIIFRTVSFFDHMDTYLGFV